MPGHRPRNRKRWLLAGLRCAVGLRGLRCDAFNFLNPRRQRGNLVLQRAVLLFLFVKQPLQAGDRPFKLADTPL